MTMNAFVSQLGTWFAARILHADASGLVLLSLLLALTAGAKPMSNADCLECHSDPTLVKTNAAGKAVSLFVDAAKLAGSVHHTNTCASCHADITRKHPDDNVAVQPVDCAR